MIQIIGWTIIHSLWQITLIAALYWLLKNTHKKQNALRQYYFGVSALLIAFLTSIITFCYLFKNNFSSYSTTTLTPELVENISPTVILESTEQLLEIPLTFSDYLPMLFPYVVVFWVIGVLFFTGRFFINLNKINKLQSTENELISGEWLAKINTFQQQLNIQKHVQVFLSAQVKEPITFGHFKPVILLPISLMTGFEPAAIETIILHELAHIKRHDYLVNLGQSIIEIILFYHPLIWWLSNDIREVREHCCDDLVLSMGDNRDAYVQTLTALQWRKIGVGVNRLSLTANRKDANFSRRIKRMFGVEERGFSFRQLMGLFLLLLIPACGGVLYQNYVAKEKQDLVNEDGVITFYVDGNTTNEDLQELSNYMRKVGVFESLCWNGMYGNVNAINGAYLDEYKNIQYFDVADIEKTPFKFEFSNGNLVKAEVIKDKNYSVYWIDKNSMGENQEKTLKELSDLGIFHGFSVCKVNNFFNGNYLVSEGKTEYVEVEDVAKTPIKIIIENSFVKSLKVIKNKDEIGSILIDDATKKEDLTEWANKLADQNIQFDFKESVFDERGNLKELRVKYKGNQGKGDFFAANLPCVNVLFKIKENELERPTFLYPCKNKKEDAESPKPYNLIPLGVNHLVDSTKTIFIISNGMTEKELWANLSEFQKITGTQITFDNMALKGDIGERNLFHSIRGKINPNKPGHQIYSFDIHDLEKYSLQFTGNSQQIFPPQYIDNSTKQVIAAKKSNKSAISSLLVDKNTSKKDLANWAKKILKHGVVFNFEKSVFNTKDRLIGLNGKFNGRCCYSDEFYHNVSDLQIKLEVKDDYVYQPIVTKNKEKTLSENNKNTLPQELIEVLKATENIRFLGDNKPQNEVSQLIPPYNPLENEVKASNPIYRPENEAERAKPILINDESNNDFNTIGWGQLEQKVNDRARTRYHQYDPSTNLALGKFLPEKSDIKIPFYARHDADNDYLEIDPYSTTNYETGHLKYDTKLIEDVDSTNLKNWIQWGNKKFPFKATFKKDYKGHTELQTPKLTFTKAEWDKIYQQPLTFNLDGEWYKIKAIKEIVLVPKRKDPISVNIHQDFYETVKNESHRVTKLLTAATINDYIYFEKIDVGKDFTIGITIEIIENTQDKSTGFIPKEDLQFYDSLGLMTLDGFPPATQKIEMPKLKINTFLPKEKPSSGRINLRGAPMSNPAYFINGIKYSDEWMEELSPDEIESINVVKGLTAKTMYGVGNAVVITTKQPFLLNNDSTFMTRDSFLKPVIIWGRKDKQKQN